MKASAVLVPVASMPQAANYKKKLHTHLQRSPTEKHKNKRLAFDQSDARNLTLPNYIYQKKYILKYDFISLYLNGLNNGKDANISKEKRS